MSNPPLIFVSGFLGSGKTSFIKQLADYFTDHQKRYAMVINEIGETGIDNQYLSQKGYAVKELSGGCICCTLADNLKQLILDLCSQYKPDVILMEPSGTASPTALYKPILASGYTKDRIIHFALIDASRAKRFEPILTPVLETSLPLATAVILTKTDCTDDDAYQFSLSMAKRYSDVPCFSLNLTEPFPETFLSYLDKSLKIIAR